MQWKHRLTILAALFSLSGQESWSGNECLANQFSTVNRPSLGMIRTIQDFYQWRMAMHFTNESIAKIPLAKRAVISGPAVLTGFDIDDRAWQYDFLSTQWSEGGCGARQKTSHLRKANDVYNFKFWQYIDTSYYFGHGVLTVPPTMWTNAAHRNGVVSLGTFNLNEVDAYSMLDSQHLHQTSQVLLDVARTLGFEGYLINYEGADSRLKVALPVLMKELKNKGLTVIWYDAPISGGFANYLNDEALPFFVPSGNFNSNYSWGYPYSSGFPQKSFQTLVKNHMENLKNNVFQMGDVYRDAYKLYPTQVCLPADKNPFFSRFKDVFNDESHSSFYSALGFYAPNWTMFGGSADPVSDTKVPEVKVFEQSDAAFWEGSGALGCGNENYRNVSYFVRPRTVISQLPFYTNFNTGVGEHYFLNGQMVSDGPWSHFTLQQILPTWQNVKMDALRPTANAYFDYETVYEGGASWKIEDTTVSKAYANFKLFKTNFVANSGDQVEWVIKTSADESLQFIINKTLVLSPTAKKMLPNGWRVFSFQLPTQVTVNECDVSVIPSTSGKINVNIGSFKIFHPGATPMPQNQQAVQQNDVLMWSLKQPGSQYRIYGKNATGGYTLLNEVVNNTYNLHGNIFNGSMDVSKFSVFIIQEVTSAGEYLPVS
jgi:endo-beta-N-acetylglucosaminidase D